MDTVKLAATAKASIKKKMSQATLAKKVHEAKVAEERAKVFLDRANSIKTELRAEVERNGTIDDSGHLWIDPVDTPEGSWHPHLQKRDPKQLDTEATEAFLREKKLWKRCSRTTVVVELTPKVEQALKKLGVYDEEEVHTQIDEDEVYACRFEDKITEEELQALYASNVTYAFYWK